MIRFAIILACLLGMGSAAQAAGFSASYSDWVIRGANVRAQFELPSADARRATGQTIPLTQEGVAKYVAAHVGARSAGGNCPALDQGFDLGLIDPLAMVGNRYRFEIFFRCPDSTGIVLQNSMLFALDPTHLDFARFDTDRGSAETFFSRRQQSISPAATQSSDGVLAFFPIGADHVWHNWDHIFFLLGLLILARTYRDLLLPAIGLVCGYALSAAVGLTCLITPDIVATQALSGLAILLLAIEALIAERRSAAPVAIAVSGCFLLVAMAPLLAHQWLTGIMLLGGGAFAASYCFLAARTPGAGFLRIVPALLFALFDGLSFIPPATAVWRNNLAYLLTGFDLGAFAIQMLVVLVVFTALKQIGRLRADYLWPLFRSGATAALCAIGLFWLARDYWN